MEAANRKTEMRPAFAIVSVMLLVAAMSGVSLIGADAATSDKGHTFIGTTPDAPAAAEVLPPTF